MTTPGASPNNLAHILLKRTVFTTVPAAKPDTLLISLLLDEVSGNCVIGFLVDENRISQAFDIIEKSLKETNLSNKEIKKECDQNPVKKSESEADYDTSSKTDSSISVQEYQYAMDETPDEVSHVPVVPKYSACIHQISNR